MKPYYEHDGIIIYHGDCREVLPELEPVDLVLTDIPYGEVNRDSNGLRNLDKGCADTANGDEPELISGICSKSYYVFCGTEQVSSIRKRFVDSGLSTRLCMWEKTNPSPMNGEYIWLSSVECCVYGKKSGAVFNEFCASPVWRFPNGSSKIHPTPTPSSIRSWGQEPHSLPQSNSTARQSVLRWKKSIAR